MNGYNPRFLRKVNAKKRAAMTPEPHSSPGPSPQPQSEIDQALRWLGGYSIIKSDGLLQRVYPTGNEEVVCRSAMARLLWEGRVPKELQMLLAMYIAPKGDELADDERLLKFDRRRRGKESNPSAVLQVALYVREDIKSGRSRQEAIELAAARFGKTIGYVGRCWDRHKSFFEATDESPSDTLK